MTDTIEDKLTLLQAPFPLEDIEWRVGVTGGKGKDRWVIPLVYITNRALQTRLDSVCGVFGWRNEFRPAPSGGILCTLYIKDNDGNWIGKEDGAENTNIEAVKGGLSDAMKRAGVQWGIGRYLYSLGESFVNVCEKGSQKGYDAKTREKFTYNPPQLPPEALPEATNDFLDFMRKAYNKLGVPKFTKALADMGQPTDPSYILTKNYDIVKNGINIVIDGEVG